jgi:hypothetical protein
MTGRAAALLAVSAIALGLPATGHAACPRMIMASGPALAEPILISDWEPACELYASFFASAPIDADLEGRPAIRLGLFWNSHVWEPHLADLRPEQADQFGRFYPAVGDEPAVVVLPGYGEWPTAVNEAGLRVLRARGIPVRLDENESAEEPWIRIGLTAGLVLALPLLLLARRALVSR